MADKFLNFTGLSYFKNKIMALLNNKADKSELPSQATDNDLGLVKLNSSESVTLNADGQLVVGGRLGQFPNGGVYYSNDRQPRSVGENTFLITDALGTNAPASRAFGIITGQGITLTASHPAGSTVYTVKNTYLNRLMCAGAKYLSVDEATSKVTQITEIVSIKVGSADLVPDSTADSTTPITITCNESANPNQAVTQLRAFRQLAGYGSVVVGNGAGQDGGGANLVMGQHAYSKTGNMNVVVGQYQYNQGNGNALFGRYHISKKNRWFMAGTGHDNSSGRSEAGTAVGQYSDIKSTTMFAVGNGTGATARSNAFEVLADGRAKSSGIPSENDDLTTKAYVDSAIGGGGLAVTTYGNADFTYQQEIDPDTQEVINECVAYSTVAGNVNEPKAVKYGRVVNMSGAFKNINVRPSSAQFVMGKVPNGCEPLYNQYIMQQGSTQYKYLLQIQTDGTMSCQRYSATSSAIAVTNNAWLNINATYISAS